MAAQRVAGAAAVTTPLALMMHDDHRRAGAFGEDAKEAHYASHLRAVLLDGAGDKTKIVDHNHFRLELVAGQADERTDCQFVGHIKRRVRH
jgi:hypothetical protein